MKSLPIHYCIRSLIYLFKWFEFSVDLNISVNLNKNIVFAKNFLAFAEDCKHLNILFKNIMQNSIKKLCKIKKNHRTDVFLYCPHSENSTFIT